MTDTFPQSSYMILQTRTSHHKIISIGVVFSYNFFLFSSHTLCKLMDANQRIDKPSTILQLIKSVKGKELLTCRNYSNSLICRPSGSFSPEVACCTSYSPETGCCESFSPEVACCGSFSPEVACCGSLSLEVACCESFSPEVICCSSFYSSLWWLNY